MKRRPKTNPSSPEAGVKREDFADGSAVITCADGSQLILESNLAKAAVNREPVPVSYKVRRSFRTGHF